MTVNSYNVEFAYELISALPYAYYLHSKGMLKKTISATGTECLYYFSPNHEINTEPRSWYNTPNAIKIPNIDIHKHFLRKEQFLPPPLKQQYANDRFKFPKKTVIICNRHNIEWGKKPINFFNLKTLEDIFKLLQNEYQIIYINIEGVPELYDNAPPITLGDYELLKKYRKVINIHKLHKKNKDLSFNELQLMLFANCEKYITMNGGHAMLASYFGGENIIMSKPGKPQSRELNPEVNSFYRWYHEFGGQRIKVVHNKVDLLTTIKSQWCVKDPVINVLIRTSNRPNYFEKCINSILTQTYKNINIYVSIDNDNKYIIKYPVHPVYVKPTTDIPPKPKDTNYGIAFPCNAYFNDLYDAVQTGLIMHLDDDDILVDNKALSVIAKEYKNGSELIFWRVQSLDRIIPNDKNWGKAPVCCDISGIGFAFDSKYKKLIKWEPYKRGDYRVSALLYKKIRNKKFIDKLLAKTQNGQHAGNKADMAKNTQITNDKWYITNEGGYWLGHEEIGNKKVQQGKMRNADISEIPINLIKR